jgi:flagellar hook-length control protein FliK
MQNLASFGQEESGQQTSGQSQESALPLRAQESVPEQITTMADFVENMMEAVSGEQTQEPVNMQQMIDIVNQVVEQIHSTMEDGATTLEMQLNPESLGKLLLSVTNKNGVMTASFMVQTTEAKVALESQMMTLRENLEQKNLKVEAVEVSVSDFAFSQSGQADTGDQKEFQHGNGRRSRFQYDEEDAEDTEDKTIQAAQVRERVMRDSGSSIDFTA